MNIERIVEKFKSINTPSSITSITDKTWMIDNQFILKKFNNLMRLEKNICLSHYLLEKNLTVAEYINTKDNKQYFETDTGYYCLYKKLNGEHIDVLKRNPYNNGLMIGKAVAVLHHNLKEIDEQIKLPDKDFREELEGWVVKEIENQDLPVPLTLIKDCKELASYYEKLPQQIIHRDMHPNNLLFEKGECTGYLDFDDSQRNSRLFDLCYLGAGVLVDSYKAEILLQKWVRFFKGALDGYQKTLPLTNLEIEAIPYMFIYIEVMFAAYFSQTNEEELIASCIELAEWLSNNKELVSSLGFNTNYLM